MMEKRGVVDPAATPDTERRLAGDKEKRAENAATKQAQIRILDDDLTKRLSEAASSRLR